MIVIGNRTEFAIESDVSYIDNASRLAIGYFVLHVAGQAYGVREADATALGCSVDAVKRRLTERGLHSVPFQSNMPAQSIAEAVRTALYQHPRQESLLLLDTPIGYFLEAMYSRNILWAPDGDEAFDDGSNVIQFDIGNFVRIIAFKNNDHDCDPVSEARLDSNVFYRMLRDWLEAFNRETAMLMSIQLSKSN